MTGHMKSTANRNLPLVTICATSYNHERFIRQCVDSLLNQTYPNIDITIVDDCSTDGSLDILRSYGDRIHLMTREKNLGIDGFCPTLNNAIRTATGQYFYRIDSDDFIESNYIERMMREALADPSLDWICGGLNVVDAEGRVTDRWEYTDWPTDPAVALARGWQTCSVLMPHNGLFRTDFLRDNNVYYENFEYGWGCDVRFTIKGALSNAHMKFLPGPGFNWRTHGANNSVNVERRVRLVLAVKEYYIENIPLRAFLKSPLLDKHPEDSDEYRAARDFLLAVDIYKAKTEFRVPAMFTGPQTRPDIARCLPLFDPLIKKYAERSLSFSSAYRTEVTALLDRMRADEIVHEGRRVLALGDFTEAAKHFTLALKTNPISVGALNGLAETAAAHGDDAASERYAVSAIQLAPQDPQALNNAGVILFRHGDYAKAEQAFLKALTLDPASEEIHLNLLRLEGVVNLRTAPDPGRAAAVIRSLRWVSEYAADPARGELLRENHALRDHVTAEFQNKYARDDIRILLHRPSNGALKYLMDSWAETLHVMGISTELLNWGDDSRTTFDTFHPTAFITVADPAFMAQIDTSFVAEYRRTDGLSIGHITTLEHAYEPCDFLITFHLDPSRDPALSAVDRPLLSLPFGINPMQHYMRPGREIWDFFFVGTNSHLKTRQTEAYLTPVLKDYQGILAGVNWRMGIGELPIDQAALFYSSATIYPNFHLESNFRRFNEITERSYIIPACGGFELTDRPVAMKELFTRDEMAQAESPLEFHEMFRHFLDHPDDRLSYIRAGMKKVYAQHTLFHVLSRLAQHVGAEKRVPTRIETTAGV